MNIKSAIENNPKAVHYALTVAKQYNFVLGGEKFGNSLLDWWENNGDWTQGQLAALRNMLIKSYLPLLERHEKKKQAAEPVVVVHNNVANLDNDEIDF